jgi:hypothetical protein
MRLNMEQKEERQMSDSLTLSPAVEALHAARSALTIAGGRVALAQRHATHGDGLDRVAIDLAAVPAYLADIALAVDRLAAAAAACEPDVLLSQVSAPNRSPHCQSRTDNPSTARTAKRQA